MSAVFRQTKQLYQKALGIELILLFCIAGAVGIGLGLNRFISLLL
ncbi:F0F1 ATP synthase subunit I/H(+)-transporting two-sector ATPase, F(0) subunit I domain protein, partial [Glaesserella parasuis 12939]